MDMTERLKDLITINERLCALLTKENTSLEQGKPSVVEPLLKEKDILARAYEARFLGMYEHIDELDGVGVDLRQSLRSASADLDSLIKRNAALLNAEIKSGHQVLQAISSAVNVTNAGIQTYSAEGTMHSPTASARRNNGSFSFNQTL